MTCDERIEILLNRASQTIGDLPFFYKPEQREVAWQAVRERMRSGWFVSKNDYLDFICHQSDVIDRMEWALEKTLQRAPKEQAELPHEELPFTDGEETVSELAEMLLSTYGEEPEPTYTETEPDDDPE